VLYLAMIHEVRPLPGARRLLEVLKERGHKVVLASSAKEEEIETSICSTRASWRMPGPARRTSRGPSRIPTSSWLRVTRPEAATR
jgi:hypothetical protein